MNRLRKEKKPATVLVSAMVRRSWCVFFLLCVSLPIGVAYDAGNGIGLHIPAEREFGEFRPAAKNTENFARKTPAFQERTLPPPPPSGTIRQVSTFEEPAFDPFPAAGQVYVPPTSVPPSNISGILGNPYDPWGTAVPAAPNYPPGQLGLLADSGGGFQGMYPMEMEQSYFHQLAMQQLAQQPFTQQPFAQQQFAQQPFAQFAPQPHQGFMMYGMNPYMEPYAAMYAQYDHYGQIDPYNMMGNTMMGNTMMGNMAGQHTQEQQFYQMLMLQEMARMEMALQQREAREIGDDRDDGDELRQQADANWTLNNLVPVQVSSPLGETLLACAQTISPFNSPSGPDKGVGRPLVGKSWLDHPYYFGGFVGVMCGSELVSRMIDQKSGGTGGLMVGYNFNDYWGLEGRVHFAAIDIRDTDYARQLFEEAWQTRYPDEPMPPLTTRTNKLTILDAAIHYYPLGNAKWRPYFKYGLGIGRQSYVNTFGVENTSNIITMPMGLGMRYWWNERIAIQMDLHDNIIFASGNTKTQHNFAFTMGLTYAFGNSRRTAPVHYWPATPSMGSKW